MSYWSSPKEEQERGALRAQVRIANALESISLSLRQIANAWGQSESDLPKHDK